MSNLAHWSEIENVNDPNDKHHVKWYGGCPRSKQELYVSHDGIGFKALPRDSGEKR